MPLKIEESQFITKVSEMSIEDLKEYYLELYNILNIKTLQKIAMSTQK